MTKPMIQDMRRIAPHIEPAMIGVLAGLLVYWWLRPNFDRKEGFYLDLPSQ
jgi:hypothetical protein